MPEPDPIRASDHDRDAAVERLGRAAAEGRLTLEELSTRAAEVYQATTRGELAAVTSDLPEPQHDTSVAPKRARRWIVSVFGDATLVGAWRAPAAVRPVSVFGDVELDLSRATLTEGRIEITPVTPFGDIDVLVPPGVEVDVSGFTLFGSKKIRIAEPAGPGSAPLVRIRAFSLFGSIKIRSG